MHLMEQIALCYRLMRVHGVAVDYYKKELQHAWLLGDHKQELTCYHHLATEYYYLGEHGKMNEYNERFMKGLLESDNSQAKKSAIF